MDIHNSAGTDAHKRHLSIGHVVSALVVVLLILLSNFVIYLSQSKKYDSVNESVSHLSQKVDSLTSQIQGIDVKLKAQNPAPNTQASSSIQTPTIPQPTIAILGAQKDTNGYKMIDVDVNITNSTSTSLSLKISSFKLLDETGNTSQDFGDGTGTTLSNGYVVLNSQTLSPGQVVKGALVFGVMDANYSDYTLTYGPESYSVLIN